MAKKQELSITVKKEENYSQWYTQIIQKADLIEYTDVSGCYVMRPNSYQIWEKIQDFFNKKIKKSGVKNAYFPLLITESLLNKEEDHIEGFAAEVAWVDYGGHSKLNERLAIRPTSEAIICDTYSKWIKSYRDLPLRLNQWCNVVRWEFDNPTPFMRNREFLWQEGHTAFETKEEADREVFEILEYYRQVYEDLLAIPTSLGRKSIKEKFAGADYSMTVEPFSPSNGKSIQGCTSHHLGHHFAKAYGIEYLDKNQKKQLPYQNSWGISVRTIAALISFHSDNKGLVLPPKVAENKVVIIPMIFKGKEEVVLNKCSEILEELEEFNPILEDDKKLNTGFKINKWEVQGIPLQIEIGPRDLEKNVVTFSLRDLDEKFEVELSNLKQRVIEEFDKMQKRLFDSAKLKVEEVTIETNNYDDFKNAIKEGKRCLVPWCETIDSEATIKEDTGAKSSCIPIEFENRNLEGVKCFFSSKPATCYAFFCKSH